MWIVKQVKDKKESIVATIQGTPEQIRDFMKCLPSENCHYSAIDSEGKHKEILSTDSKIVGFFKSLF